MASDPDLDPPTAELYVQSLTPSGCRAPQSRAIERLDRLAAEGALADVRVVVWGSRVGLSTTAARTDPGRYVLDRVAAFKNWAMARNVSVAFQFPTREVRSDVTGESFTALSLPAMVLAEFDGSELAHVAPYRRGDETVTVSDRLDDIETASESDSAVVSESPDRHAEPLPVPR